MNTVPCCERADMENSVFSAHFLFSLACVHLYSLSGFMWYTLRTPPCYTGVSFHERCLSKHFSICSGYLENIREMENRAVETKRSRVWQHARLSILRFLTFSGSLSLFLSPSVISSSSAFTSPGIWPHVGLFLSWLKARRNFLGYMVTGGSNSNNRLQHCASPSAQSQRWTVSHVFVLLSDQAGPFYWNSDPPFIYFPTWT